MKSDDDVLALMEAITLAQHARDLAEDQLFVDLGMIDLGGEA